MTPVQPPLSPVAATARWVYLAVVALFAAAVVLQVFLAGLAALVNPQYWSLHRTSGDMIGPLVIGVVLVAFAARLPWRLLALNVLLFALFACQYVFLYTLPSLGAVGLRALHAVNALALFWLATHLMGRAWRLLRPRPAANVPATGRAAETVRGFPA